MKQRDFIEELLGLSFSVDTPDTQVFIMVEGKRYDISHLEEDAGRCQATPTVHIVAKPIEDPEVQ
jgi:hypothetical protein